ncbi:MAG: 4-hydroxythreonine-4-phosphate dehydrogenase PdxA, partial [Lutimaribacter sp.]
LPVLAHDFGPAATPGQANPAHAAHVIAVIEQAVGFVQNAQASALCTAPIHKKALQDGAGFAFPGHTEFLAHLAGQNEVVMMLACAALRVVPATIHIPLAAVPQALTPDLLRQTITLTHHAMQRDFGIAAPRIAVAGLNPHAGEGGAMGQEELRWIAPLLAQMRAGGIDIIGPLPADTMFHARARAGYDVAICMYHDQALIPIKTIDFDHGVNISLGLPFVRTSPDHGTAFDIAGRGQANPSSLIAALRMGAEMAKARQNAQHSQS